jgi:hypothetical protein
MHSILSRQVIELLDRKYAFVAESSVENFMLDLQQFIQFITENEFIRDFTFNTDLQRKMRLNFRLSI